MSVEGPRSGADRLDVGALVRKMQDANADQLLNGAEKKPQPTDSVMAQVASEVAALAAQKGDPSASERLRRMSRENAFGGPL